MIEKLESLVQCKMSENGFHMSSPRGNVFRYLQIVKKNYLKEIKEEILADASKETAQDIFDGESELYQYYVSKRKMICGKRK